MVRAESVQIQQGVSPAVAALSTEIADLESLIEARPARAATLRPLIEELREKQVNLRRAASRKAQSSKAAEFPAEEAYRAAAADMAATLKGSNIEAARGRVTRARGQHSDLCGRREAIRENRTRPGAALSVE
jgi:hypothetical protein